MCEKRENRIAVRIAEKDYRTVLEVAVAEGMPAGKMASRIVSDWAFAVRARRPPQEALARTANCQVQA